MKYGRIASKSMMFITSQKKAKWFGAAAKRTRNSALNQTASLSRKTGRRSCSGNSWK